MKLTRAIGQYVEELPKTRGRNGRKSARTVATYESGLRRLLLFLDDQGRHAIPSTGLATEDVIGFARWMAEQGLSESTMNTYLVATTSFCRWLLRQGEAGFDPVELDILNEELKETWRSGNVDRIPKVPPEKDVQAVLGVAHATDEEDKRKHLLHLRNTALVETLRSTGARVQELSDLDRRDLRPKDRTALVRGKGRKKRFIFFSDEAWNALQHYLQARDAAGMVPTEETEPVFARHDLRSGNRVLRLGTNSIRWNLNRLCQASGVERITPHQWRHRFATRVLQQTRDLAGVQHLLGHESSNTTEIYARLVLDDLRETYEKTDL